MNLSKCTNKMMNPPLCFISASSREEIMEQVVPNCQQVMLAFFDPHIWGGGAIKDKDHKATKMIKER
jgi:hypothetical protein